MDLNTLATTLRAQATANSTIVLDSTVFPSSVLDGIRTAFALAPGTNLTIAGVQAADILAPNANGVLTISVGTASVLNQSGVGIGLTFMAPGSSLEAVITATMRPSWKFSDSFKGLDIFPFQDLNTSDARFVYATAAQTASAWPGEPSYTIDLEPGLNFLSDVTLGNFPVISTLLGVLIGADPFKFYGPFAPMNGEQLPVGTIKAPLGSGAFDIGVKPNALTLGNSRVAVRIGTSDAESPIQDIDLLVEADFNNTLKFAVGIPMSGSTLEISTTPLPNHSSINSLIESLPGGSDFTSYIPSELSSIFTDVGLDNFSMVVAPTPKVTYLGLSIRTLKRWPVIPPDVLVLDGLTLQIQTVDPTGLNWKQVFIKATAQFLPKIFTGEFDFTVALQKQPSWEVSTVSGAYYGAVSLGDIVSGLLGNPNSVPAALRVIQFSDFGVNATRSAPGSPFTYSFYGSVEVAFPILDRELTAALNLAVTKTPEGHTIHLGGSLIIGDESFALALDLGTADSKLSATWQTTEKPLGFEDIAAAFGFDVPTIPAGLDLALTSASFTYDFTENTIVLEAVSANYGDALFVAFKPAAEFVYLFGLKLGKTSVLSQISLTKLPLIGDKVPESANVSVDNIGLILASALINKESVKTLTDGKLIPAGFLPAEGLTSKVGFGMTLDLGGHLIPINLGASATAEEAQPVVRAPVGSAGKSTALVTQSAAGAAAPQTAPTQWIVVQKTFGPVTIQKIGVRYKDNTLYILANLSFSAGGLTIDLLGIGIGSPIKVFQPTFTIDGLEITFAQGPIEISGGLYGTLDPINFYGAVMLKAEVLTLGALGGYAEIDNHPSFFMYLALDYPLGGPSFFFVTGLAAGFGFNRKLLLPDITNVPTYPFVAWALGNDNPPAMDFNGNAGAQAGDALTSLINAGIVAPAIGEDWLAAGIRFSSFEILDSFALATVIFGNAFEVALLGLSTLKLPTGVETPVAEVQLAFKVTFAPSEGLLAIAAQLTNNSYVLSKDARLTGGFAFYLWLGGEHAGDFVVTLGGYSPRFPVPAYYPTVPRLGLHWQVLPELSITGDLYFALTSNAVMAGGGLSAVWHSGPIKAWFDVEADFLLVFKPFHYYISAGIHLGASFTLDLLFTSLSITIHIGVDLSVWGPEFQGKAKVDLDIISFTISFGDGGPATSTEIGWDDFTQQLLPKQPAKRAPAVGGPAGEAAPAPAVSVVHIKIIDGLTKQVTYGDGKQELYVINPQTFVVETYSVIPSKTSSANGALILTTPPTGNVSGENVPSVVPSVVPIVFAPDDQQPLDASGKPIVPNTDFGIGPTGTAHSDFESEHQITFTTTEAGEWVQAVQVVQNVPKALWEKKTFDRNGVPQLGDDALSATTISNALTGYRLIPQLPKEGSTRPIEMAYLQYTIDEKLQGFAWSVPTYPTQGVFSGASVESTINSQLAQHNRQLLVEAIPDGLVADRSLDVANLASSTRTYLMEQPVFCLLAEEITMPASPSQPPPSTGEGR